MEGVCLFFSAALESISRTESERLFPPLPPAARSVAVMVGVGGGGCRCVTLHPAQ